MTITIETKTQTFLNVVDAWDGYNDTLELTLISNEVVRVNEKDVAAINGKIVNNEIEYHMYDILDKLL